MTEYKYNDKSYSLDGLRQVLFENEGLIFSELTNEILSTYNIESIETPETTVSDTIKSLKEDINSRYNIFRDSLLYGNGTVKSSLGFTIDADYISLYNINILKDISTNDTLEFKDASNTFHTINKSDLIILKEEVQQYIYSVIQDTFNKKKELESINDIDTLKKLRDSLIDLGI